MTVVRHCMSTTPIVPCPLNEKQTKTPRHDSTPFGRNENRDLGSRDVQGAGRPTGMYELLQKQPKNPQNIARSCKVCEEQPCARKDLFFRVNTWETLGVDGKREILEGIPRNRVRSFHSDGRSRTCVHRSVRAPPLLLGTSGPTERTARISIQR